MEMGDGWTSLGIIDFLLGLPGPSRLRVNVKPGAYICHE
jgi:hypothetical protein